MRDLPINKTLVVLKRTKFHPLRIRTYLSVLIRLFTKSYYNHVAAVVWIDGVAMIIEADKVMMLTQADHWFKDEDDYKLVEPCFEFNQHEFDLAVLNCLGWQKYDYAGTMFFQMIYQLFHRWIGSTGEKAKKKMYCSKLIAFFFNLDKWWLWIPNDFDTSNLFKNYK